MKSCSNVITRLVEFVLVVLTVTCIMLKLIPMYIDLYDEAERLQKEQQERYVELENQYKELDKEVFGVEDE